MPVLLHVAVAEKSGPARRRPRHRRLGRGSPALVLPSAAAHGRRQPRELSLASVGVARCVRRCDLRLHVLYHGRR